MILFFHDLYSCVKNLYHPLISQFYSFTKNVSLNINFTFSQKLTFNANVFILPWLFWQWSFGEDLMFFSCCLLSDYIVENMIYILTRRILITFLIECFILLLGEFVLVLWFILFCLYDLYSCLENLYNFSCRMIYSLSGICIILLVVWFILALGNLYHFASSVIYTPIWGICIILLVVWFILPLGEFVSFYSSYICIILLVIWFILSLGEFVSFVARKILWSNVVLDLLKVMLLFALNSTYACQNLIKQEF